MEHLSSPAPTPCALCLHSCRRPQLLVAKITCNFCSALLRPSLAVPSLDDSQITQENRETAETELAQARVRGYFCPLPHFLGADRQVWIYPGMVADMNVIPVFIPDPE